MRPVGPGRARLLRARQRRHRRHGSQHPDRRGGRGAVEADGLTRGKGGIVCAGVEESDDAVEAMLVEQRFGRSGSKIVVEERLEGPELSLLGVTDGTDVIALAPARDYKRAL